jgi:hypothetical protein
LPIDRIGILVVLVVHVVRGIKVRVGLVVRIGGLAQATHAKVLAAMLNAVLNAVLATEISVGVRKIHPRGQINGLGCRIAGRIHSVEECRKLGSS